MFAQDMIQKILHLSKTKQKIKGKLILLVSIG